MRRIVCGFLLNAKKEMAEKRHQADGANRTNPAKLKRREPGIETRLKRIFSQAGEGDKLLPGLEMLFTTGEKCQGAG